MQGLRANLAICLLLTACGVAHADLSSAPISPWADDPGRLQSTPISAPVAAAEETDGYPWNIAGLPSCPPHPIALPQGQPPRGSATIRTLPPAPPSLMLTLSAFGGLAAWQLGRSARHVKLGHFPEWFHTGAPARIGRTTVVDPTLAPQPAAALDAPRSSHPPLPIFGLAEVRIPVSPRTLSPEQPRGPPLRPVPTIIANPPK